LSQQTLLTSPSDISGAALQQLEMLHAKMSSAGSASRMHTLGQQFQREAANLQVLAKKQLQILGVTWNIQSDSAGPPWSLSRFLDLIWFALGLEKVECKS
jgi:hypothetical protein